jgi:hypothetical protein
MAVWDGVAARGGVAALGGVTARGGVGALGGIAARGGVGVLGGISVRGAPCALYRRASGTSSSSSSSSESYPNDLLEICYFYISQMKSSLDKIFYKVVYHHIIYMCEFFGEFR